jgi:hypothetical protein
MININKKYKTANGSDVVIYAIYPKQLTKQVHGALVYADGEVSSNAWNINGTFLVNETSMLDLIEVIPYSGWNIDDKVIVTFEELVDKEYNYYFAGLNGLGQPCVFSDGCTSWSNISELIPVTTIRKFEE